MRVSEKYELGREQPSLDFVDVDIRDDTHLFIDPRALHQVDTDWTQGCVSDLQSFFSVVLSRIQAGDDTGARTLLASLGEPNETHLGLSEGRARGRGMGHDLAKTVWEGLKSSRAVETGLLEDLEDTVLFVEHIGHDIISDITTNIIRGPLISYTQEVAAYYGIPLGENVVSGRIWDGGTRRWTQGYTALPVTDYGRLLLVPKAIVRRSPSFDPGDYYENYILPFLADQEMSAPSGLVQVLKNGRRRVTKKSLRKRYGVGKRVNLDITLQHPELLDHYRSAKSRRQLPPDHTDLAEVTRSPEPDWDKLLNNVRAVQPGPDQANRYHLAVEALLSAVFYPALILPVRESKIHEGRKRLDIKYTNDATYGFFRWLHAVHKTPSAFVVVECKNYGSELGNPEFDQLTGRFAPQRGQIGFLCYRGFGNKAAVIRRCRDAALDHRGYVIALDDGDLAQLVEDRRTRGIQFAYLNQRFGELI
jgi:hypothetical protein